MSDGYAVKVRPEKVAAVKQIRESLERSSAVLLTEYRGLTVGELAELRSHLRQAQVEYKVTKNTLTLRAACELGIEGLESLLEGPTAVAFCFADPVAAAKALAAFAKDHQGLVVKGGVLDGRALTAADAEGLSKIDALEVSLAKICGALVSPLAGIAGALEGPLRQILYVVDQLASREAA